MAVHGNGADGQSSGPPVPGDPDEATDREVRVSTRDDADYRKALTDAIATALEERARLERVIASGIRRQVELYDRSVPPAGEVATPRLVKDGSTVAAQSPETAEHGKAGVEVLPPGMVGKLVAADVHKYRELKDPAERAEATLAMAETARISAGYRAELAGTAPDVSDAVRTAMALAGKSGKIRAAPAPADGPAVPQELRAGGASQDPAEGRAPAAPGLTEGHRTRNKDARAGQLTLNGIEHVVRQTQGERDAQTAVKRQAHGNADVNRTEMPARAPGANQVASDEVFTASREGAKPVLPAEVEDRYLRVGSRFYHSGNRGTVAFEDKGNRLETRSNSTQVAGAMVTVARARGWDEIRVTGSETFRREVWLEAAAHGMKVKGYTPGEVDRAALAKRSRHVGPEKAEPDGRRPGNENRYRSAAEPPGAASVRARGTESAGGAAKTGTGDLTGDREPEAGDLKRARAFAQQPAADALREYPELAGTYAVMASIRKRAAADGLSPKQRAVVMARIEANLAGSIARGELPQVKVREQVGVRREHTVNREEKR